MTEEFPFDALPGEPTQINPTPNGPAAPEPTPVTRQRKPRTDKGQPRKQRGERKTKPRIVDGYSVNDTISLVEGGSGATASVKIVDATPRKDQRYVFVLAAIEALHQLNVEDAKYVAGLFV